MQIQLLNRQKWRSKIEFAIAIADYIEHFYNAECRHSSLDYDTPVEFEDPHSKQTQTTFS
jgi:putative transposase